MMKQAGGPAEGRIFKDTAGGTLSGTSRLVTDWRGASGWVWRWRRQNAGADGPWTPRHFGTPEKLG